MEAPAVLKTRYEFEAATNFIKRRMPLTYKVIIDKVNELGMDACCMVLQGLRGIPNAFYAIEGGNIVGTEYTHEGVMLDLSQMRGTYGHVDVVLLKTDLILHGAH
jgi:hypothetical protein